MQKNDNKIYRGMMENWEEKGDVWLLVRLLTGQPHGPLAETGKYIAYEGTVHWEMACKCGIYYRAEGRPLRRKADAARAGGVDVYLSDKDRATAC